MTPLFSTKDAVVLLYDFGSHIDYTCRTGAAGLRCSSLQKVQHFLKNGHRCSYYRLHCFQKATQCQVDYKQFRHAMQSLGLWSIGYGDKDIWKWHYFLQIMDDFRLHYGSYTWILNFMCAPRTQVIKKFWKKGKREKSNAVLYGIKYIPCTVLRTTLLTPPVHCICMRHRSYGSHDISMFAHVSIDRYRNMLIICNLQPLFIETVLSDHNI